MNIDPDIPKSLQLYTADQSRDIDQKTIEEFGINSFTLMEIAAKGAAETIQTKIGPDKKGLYICGKGNNAGDALAAARYLAENARHQVSIYFVFGSDGLSSDTGKNLRLLNKLSAHGKQITFVESLDSAIQQCDYIVDGIFGTGLYSDVRSPAKEIIEKINQSGKQIFSMDLPSGLNSDYGFSHGVAVYADFTCTFGTQKIGLYINEGPDHSGIITFIDLPFPSFLRTNYITSVNEHLKSVLPEISRSARHKYESGVVHLVAGSKGLTGAAIMAAKSAWKQGAGSVILYAPEKLLSVYETTLPHAIKVPLPNAECYLPSHSKIILERISEKPGVLLIGPGIGTKADTKDFVFRILNEYSGPAVIDADALAAWETIKEIEPDTRKNWLLTPHPGEAKKYLNLNSLKKDPISAAAQFSAKHNLSLLLKGKPVVYISESGTPFITGYNTSPFARAGFGDVLSGTIAAIWGITGSAKWAPVYALLDGYKKFKAKAKTSESFGPEDFT